MPEPLFQTVIDVVARYYAIEPSSILGPSRMKSVMVARHTAMYVARIAGEFSYPQIGTAFRKDHSTVMSACRRMVARSLRDERYRSAVDQLVREVLGLGVSGGPVKIRKEILALLETRVQLGIFGRSIEDLVDRILCEYFQRESQKL